MRKYKLKKFIKIKGADKLQFVVCWYCGALIEVGLACFFGKKINCLRCSKISLEEQIDFENKSAKI